MRGKRVLATLIVMGNCGAEISWDLFNIVKLLKGKIMSKASEFFEKAINGDSQAALAYVSFLWDKTDTLAEFESQHYPIQPIVTDKNGTMRFKENQIVRDLFDTHPSLDMNLLAALKYSAEDRQQFAMLIGYTIGGFNDLSYVTDDVCDAVNTRVGQTSL